MPFARLFAIFLPSFGLVFPSKALLFSKTFFPFYDFPSQMQPNSSRNMLVVRKKAFVPLTRKFSKVSVIPLDAIKNASRKSGTPRSLGSMVWTPSRMLVPPSLVRLKNLQLLRRKHLARLRQDFKRHITRSVTIKFIHRITSSESIHQIVDRAQSDPQYRESLDALFDIIQKRLNKTVDAASDPKVTLSSFIADPTPEQHIPKALTLLRTLVERLTNAPLEPLIERVRTCATSILKDTELKSWFDDFFTCARQNLSEPGYARSEEAESKRQELWVRWKETLEKNDKWKKAVDSVKNELQKFEAELKKDEDLNRVKEAHEKFGMDMEEGLVEAETGVQAAIEQATWFWQDLFKVYVPRVLSKMRDVPVPRFIFFFFLSVHFFNAVFYLELNIRMTILNSSSKTSTSLPSISSLHMSIYATSRISIYSPPLLRPPLVQQ